MAMVKNKKRSQKPLNTIVNIHDTEYSTAVDNIIILWKVLITIKNLNYIFADFCFLIQFTHWKFLCQKVCVFFKNQKINSKLYKNIFTDISEKYILK